jgi:alkane 1-monooxygenase
VAAPTLVAPGGVVWRDGRRYLWLTALELPLLPIVAFGLWHRTGNPLHWWLTPLFVFVILPLLDLTAPADPANPPEGVSDQLQADRFYRWCTYLYLPLQAVGLVLGCWAWAHGDLSWLERAGMVASIGAVSGIGINTAHELGHKRERAERWLSKVALAPTAYGHFYVEHNRGHHVRVATPEDPASARLGESFWRFWPRTVVGSLRSAWRLETRRLGRHGRGPWTPRNDILNAWLLTVLLFAALAAGFGPGVLPLLAAQAVFGFSLLEVVNYIEHYGLARQRTATDRYEKADPRHSWNSDAFLSNLALYQLQRHSDHHANPTRRYQALRSFDSSPQLPSGYGTMVILAVVPPLWRRVMDHRVVTHYGGDVTLANIEPSRRERLTKRYGRRDQQVSAAEVA